MAYVSSTPKEHMAEVITYALRKAEPNMGRDSELCTPSASEAIQEMKAAQKIHNFKGKNKILEIHQAFTIEDRDKLSIKEFNLLGRKLVEEKFKGHQFIVATHTDTPHIHNHIIVNRVNLESGRLIKNKFHHLHDLRKISNDLCKEKGLSVIQGKQRDREANMPEVAKKIQKHRGTSYIYDTLQKANFAKHYSRNFDEYAGILSELGINVRVENKNITYFYPGYEKGKRGSKLGKPYAKEGLEQTFKENKDKFLNHPGISSIPQSEIISVFTAAKSNLRGYENLPNIKPNIPDLNSKEGNTHTKRRQNRYTVPSEDALKNSILPINELRKAGSGNIINYCKRNRIGIEKHKDGSYRLKGKEYVVLSESGWKNAKNKTSGNLIDFVAAHKNVSFLHAVSQINNNPRLLLLGQSLGTPKRPYTSFYMFSDKSGNKRSTNTKTSQHVGMKQDDSIRQIGDFLRTMGAHSKTASELYQTKKVRTPKTGIVQLLSDRENDGGFEYQQNEKGKWTKQGHGSDHGSFLSKKGTSNRLIVFGTPESFFKGLKGALWGGNARDSQLVLMSQKRGSLDRFIASNTNVSEILFVPSQSKEDRTSDLKLFNEIKKDYTRLGISLGEISRDKARDFAGPEKGLSR